MTEPEALSLEEALDRAINRAAADQLDVPRGVSTGFADLDSLTGGLRPGTLTVLASRPAVGRSTLLLDFCRNAAIPGLRRPGPHVPVLHISLEDGTNETVQRIMASESRVALHHLRSGTLTPEDVTRLERRMPTIANAPLYLWDPARATAAQIASAATRYVEDNDVQLVAIDGIQDIRPEKQNDLREREVGDVVRDLKALARQLDIPIVATSHLNRAPEQRHDRVPMLDDLRESGAITFAADTILLLHRPDAYERETPRAGEADFLVVKHRQGPTATITVAFQGHYSRFVEFAM